MPENLRPSDLKQFNAGDMAAQDFESGDFGKLDVGSEFQEGDYVNFMAQGIMGPDGLEIKHLAVLGSDEGSAESPGDQAPDEGEADPKAKMMMDKLTEEGQ